MTGSLAGKRIVVPESRELDLFARMLEDEGAVTLRCPMVTILDLDDDAPAAAWLKRLTAGEFTDLILLTGEGLRRLLGAAKRAGIDAALAVENLHGRKFGVQLYPGNPNDKLLDFLRGDDALGGGVGGGEARL